jgi:hypothetical protein
MDEFYNHFQSDNGWMEPLLQLACCMGCGHDHPWGDQFSDPTDLYLNRNDKNTN